MAMQTDILSTKSLTSTGVLVSQANANITYPVRLKAVYCVNAATAGTVTIANGNGGTVLLALATPASAASGYTYILLPGEGILAPAGLYATIATTTSCVLFYG